MQEEIILTDFSDISLSIWEPIPKTNNSIKSETIWRTNEAVIAAMTATECESPRQ